MGNPDNDRGARPIMHKTISPFEIGIDSVGADVNLPFSGAFSEQPLSREGRIATTKVIDLLNP